MTTTERVKEIEHFAKRDDCGCSPKETVFLITVLRSRESALREILAKPQTHCFDCFQNFSIAKADEKVSCLHLKINIQSLALLVHTEVPHRCCLSLRRTECDAPT